MLLPAETEPSKQSPRAKCFVWYLYLGRVKCSMGNLGKGGGLTPDHVAPFQGLASLGTFFITRQC